jgi:hypothetical protein
MLDIFTAIMGSQVSRLPKDWLDTKSITKPTVEGALEVVGSDKAFVNEVIAQVWNIPALLDKLKHFIHERLSKLRPV